MSIRHYNKIILIIAFILIFFTLPYAFTGILICVQYRSHFSTYIIIYLWRNVKNKLNTIDVNFKEYTFLKEQSEAHGLTKEIEEYIDNKLSNIEGRLKEIDKFGKYNVIPAGKGLLDVVNIDTHAIEAKLSYEGEIISSLVVHGDKVSFAVQKGGDIEDQHEVIGLIYEIPSGQNIGNFNVPQEDPGEKYRTTVGTITQDEPDFSDELDMQDKSDEEEELSDVRPDGEDDEQRHKDEMEKIARDQELEDLRKEVERQKKEVQAITPPQPKRVPAVDLPEIELPEPEPKPKPKPKSEPEQPSLPGFGSAPARPRIKRKD